LEGADARLVGLVAAVSPSTPPGSSLGRGGATVVPWRAASSRPPVDCRTGRAGRGLDVPVPPPPPPPPAAACDAAAAAAPASFVDEH